MIEQVHAGTLEQELHDAIAYCKAAVVHPDWLIAVGSAAAVAALKEVLKKLVGDGPRRIYQTRSSLEAYLDGWTWKIEPSR